jgi:hypothetical protein
MKQVMKQVWLEIGCKAWIIRLSDEIAKLNVRIGNMTYFPEKRALINEKMRLESNMRDWRQLLDQINCNQK